MELDSPSPRTTAQAVKRRVLLSAVVARDVKLRRSGAELAGLCPFHAESRPSFFVNDAKGVYFCFGCSASGDVIDYVRARHGVDFAGALEWLGAVPPGAGVDCARAAPGRFVQDSAGLAEARAIWRRSRPVAGTPAELYLRRRGIARAPGTVRFARVALWRDPAGGRSGRWAPALVAAAQDATGRLTGVQRICLTPDGRKLGPKAKLSIGRIRGSALRLGPPAAHIVLCEGPEDGLTLAQARAGTSVWVSLGTANLAAVVLPPVVRAVTLAGDNNAAGRAAVERAIAAYAAQGRIVDAAFPPAEFADWNDELLGRRDAGSQAAPPRRPLPLES